VTEVTLSVGLCQVAGQTTSKSMQRYIIGYKKSTQAQDQWRKACELDVEVGCVPVLQIQDPVNV